MTLFSRYFIVLYLTIALYSCNKKVLEVDPINNTKDSTSTAVTPKYLRENSWIYTQMKTYYLWESTMPAEDKTDKNLEPKQYFRSLVNSEKDWFSYMKLKKEDILDYWNGHIKSYGFRYTAYKLEGQTNQIGLSVSLVLLGSPAEKAGLWRGDLITKINGNAITEANLLSLLDADQVTFSWINTDNIVISKQISKISFQINPIQAKFIFEDSLNKIGYLSYTQFLPNEEDNLRKAFIDFKSKNVNEFILDLRFNPGGFTPNTEIMASLLVKNLKPNTEMFHNIWNVAQTAEKKKNEGEKAGIRTWTAEPNNLSNLNRIFILTSKTTASSSELIINSLKNEMEVIIIGDHTYGKNVISAILTDETGALPLAIMPAYTTIFNSKGETYASREGFTPTFKVEDNVFPYYPLGNSNETLLRKVLSIIRKTSEDATIDKVHFRATLIDGYQHFDSGSSFDSK